MKPLRIRRPASALSLLLAALVAGCGTAPVPYARPVLEMPAAWTVQAPWRESAPNDRLPRGPWWERFGDARLNALQQQALGGNPSLAIAAARLAQARALMGAAGASKGPQVSTGARVARQRISANRPLSRYDSPNFSTVQDDYTLSLQVAYEVDLWGRVQSVVDASQASAEQIAADLENVRLVLSTDLAAAYFNLRQTDIELDVMAKSIALQRRALGFGHAGGELRERPIERAGGRVVDDLRGDLRGSSGAAPRPRS